MTDYKKALHEFERAMMKNDASEIGREAMTTIRTALEQAQRVEVIIKALEFYADSSNYEPLEKQKPCGCFYSYPEIEEDEGKKAREILSAFRQEKV